MGLKYSQTLLHLQNSILLYSIYAIFFQLVIDGLYINVLFLSNILSDTLISWPFMLVLSWVISCILLTESFY